MTRSPDQIAATWAQNLGAAGERIKEGVQAVQVAPGMAAARQSEVWAQNTIASKDKWKRNTAAVPLGDWQTAMIEKGTPRIAQGAAAAQGKFTNFMGQLLPHIDTVKRGLPARGNLEANIVRAATFARGMAAFKYNR